MYVLGCPSCFYEFVLVDSNKKKSFCTKLRLDERLDLLGILLSLNIVIGSKIQEEG